MKLAQPRSLLPALGTRVTTVSCSAQGWPQWQLDGELLQPDDDAQRWDSGLQLYYGEGSGDIRATDVVSMRLDLVF